MKKINIYSTLALFSLINIGCGGGTNTTPTQNIVQNNSKAVSINDLKSLKMTSRLEYISNSDMTSSVNKASEIGKLEDATTLCNTGKIDFTLDEPTKTMSFSAEKCFDGTSTLDGVASVKFEESNQENFISVIFNVLRNITFSDNENKFSINRGANISVVNNGLQDATSYTLNATFKSKINDVVLNVSDLEVTTISASCGFMGPLDDCIESESYTVTKGSFNIGENYFEIDESKENTIIVDELGYKNGGAVYMHDGAGHNVEISVENKTLVLKIDENGDGIFSDNEVLK